MSLLNLSSGSCMMSSLLEYVEINRGLRQRLCQGIRQRLCQGIRQRLRQDLVMEIKQDRIT